MPALTERHCAGWDCTYTRRMGGCECGCSGCNYVNMTPARAGNDSPKSVPQASEAPKNDD